MILTTFDLIKLFTHYCLEIVPGSHDLSSRPVGSDHNPALEQSNRFVVHAFSCYLRRCTPTKEEKLNCQRNF